jgi:hypothetical protein
VITSINRADGSSATELFIPSWFVVFYDNGGKLGIREQSYDSTGEHIELYEAHAILLHNALVKWREFHRAATVGANVLGQALQRATIPKL